MRKSAQSNSSNGGPDAALEGAFHGWVMLHLKVHLRVQFKEPLKMHKNVTKRKHSTLHLMVHLEVHLLIQLGTPLRVHQKVLLKLYLEIYIQIHKKVHFNLKLRVHWGNNWIALEDAHDGALFRAQECTKQFNEKVNLRGHSILHLSTPKISL